MHRAKPRGLRLVGIVTAGFGDNTSGLLSESRDGSLLLSTR